MLIIRPIQRSLFTRTWLFTLLLCLLLSPANIAGAATPLADLFDRNWGAWSHGQDTVTYRALVDELPNPAYTGESAAALAALAHKLHFGHLETGVSRSQAIELANNDKALQTRYANILSALPNLSRQLYATGKPNFEALKQGPIGDCFFFSGIGWLSRYRPQIIMQAIQPQPNGTYLVNFPIGMQAVVPKPTDAEILFFNSASTITDGLWVSILEKAVGTILPNYTQRVVDRAEPEFNIALGGAPAMIEHIWTGVLPTVVYLDKRPSRQEIRSALIRMQERRLMSQALTPARSIAHSVAGDHVYAILGFDPTTDTLTLWNPWGDDFTSKGPEGLQNGYARQHGVFMMPLDEFRDVFWVLSIE